MGPARASPRLCGPRNTDLMDEDHGVNPFAIELDHDYPSDMELKPTQERKDMYKSQKEWKRRLKEGVHLKDWMPTKEEAETAFLKKSQLFPKKLLTEKEVESLYTDEHGKWNYTKYYNDLVPGRARGDPCSSDEAFLFHDPSIREAPEQWMNRRPSRTLYPTVPDADRHAPGLPLSDMQTDSTTPDDFKPPETHSWSTFSEEAAPYFKRLFQGAEDEGSSAVEKRMQELYPNLFNRGDVSSSTSEQESYGDPLKGIPSDDTPHETVPGQLGNLQYEDEHNILKWRFREPKSKPKWYRSSDAEYFQGDIGSRSEADEDTDIGVPVNKTRLRELEHMSLQARLRRGNKSIIPFGATYNTTEGYVRWKKETVSPQTEILAPWEQRHMLVPRQNEEWMNREPENTDDEVRLLANLTDDHWKPNDEPPWFPGIVSNEALFDEWDMKQRRAITRKMRKFYATNGAIVRLRYLDTSLPKERAVCVLEFNLDRHTVTNLNPDSKLRFVMDSDPRLVNLDTCRWCNGETDYDRASSQAALPQQVTCRRWPHCRFRINPAEELNADFIVTVQNAREVCRKEGIEHIRDRWRRNELKWRDFGYLLNRTSGPLTTFAHLNEELEQWRNPALPGLAPQPQAASFEECPRCGSAMSCTEIQTRRADEGVSELWNCHNCSYSYRIDP